MQLTLMIHSIKKLKIVLFSIILFVSIPVLYV